jgi:hypothetical protein
VPIWSRSIRNSHRPLYSAARHWFGSYSGAVEAAGLDYRQVRQMEMGRWNRKTVVQELRKLRREKVPLHHAAIERHRADLVLAAYRYFGSYRAAVKAAGLPYERIRIREMPSWDKKRIIGELRRFKAEGHGLWKRAARRKEPYIVRAAKRCFGSYERAAKAAGIDAALLQPPTYRFWSPQRIVEDLQKLYRKSPSRLKPADLIVSHPRLLRACRRQFSTYREALQAARIPYAEVARVTEPALLPVQIVEQLQELFEEGKDLRYSKMAVNHPRIINSARARFGTYANAMRAARLDYPPLAPVRHWTAAIVIKNLRELERRETDLRMRAVRRKHLPLYEACRHYFGNYPSAVRAAGIDYDAMVQRQLRRFPARHAKKSG